MAKYQVLAPLVQLKLRDAAGALVFRHFYAGAVLDTDEVNLDEDHLRSQIDGGLVVEEGEPVAQVFAVPAGTPLPGQPPNTEVTEASSTAQPIPPLSPEQLRAAGIDASGDEPFAAGSTERDGDQDRGRRAGRPRTTEDKATWYEYRVAERVANRPDDQSEEDARAQAQADLADRSKAQLVAGE